MGDMVRFCGMVVTEGVKTTVPDLGTTRVRLHGTGLHRTPGKEEVILSLRQCHPDGRSGFVPGGEERGIMCHLHVHYVGRCVTAASDSTS